MCARVCVCVRSIVTHIPVEWHNGKVGQMGPAVKHDPLVIVLPFMGMMHSDCWEAGYLVSYPYGNIFRQSFMIVICDSNNIKEELPCMTPWDDACPFGSQSQLKKFLKQNSSLLCQEPTRLQIRQQGLPFSPLVCTFFYFYFSGILPKTTTNNSCDCWEM